MNSITTIKNSEEISYRAQSVFFDKYIFKSSKHLFSRGTITELLEFNEGNNLQRTWYTNNCKRIK